MRLLLASIQCEKGDVGTNLDRHLEVLATARAAGCGLAVFPEMSLTGSVDAVRRPADAVTLDSDPVRRMAAATADAGVDALFGLAERHEGGLAITQAHAVGGRLAGVQRKRHLGEDEEGFAVGRETAVFGASPVTFATVICAEAGVDACWDASAATGAPLLLFCSAPGLHGRRTDEQGWRDGFAWWEDHGLGSARRAARRLRRWVAMATQAGSTVDEDFPGIAALVAPSGAVVERLPDWRPGTLVVDVPVAPAHV